MSDKAQKKLAFENAMAKKQLMDEGKQYLIIQTNGWGFVGTFVKYLALNCVLLTHAHFITKCGDDTDWGKFLRNGPGPNAIVNKTGDTTIVNLDFLLWLEEMPHELPPTR